MARAKARADFAAVESHLYAHGVAGTLHVGAQHLWPPRRESFPAGARPCTPRTTPTNGASERSLRTRRAAPLSLTELGQNRDVQIGQSPSGKPHRDFLEHPAVAVRIAECRLRYVRLIFGPRPDTRRSPRSRVMESLTYVGTASDELRACRLDVGHHEIRVLGRSRLCGRDSPAEVDGARRARGVICTARQLSLPRSPRRPATPSLRRSACAIDVGHRDDDGLELQIDRVRCSL